MKKSFFLLITITLIVSSISWAELKPYSASSDRVLVLYNEDYSVDAEGSSPGQDSREVAEYYSKMYTDPVTGAKPYLLGLKCRHGKKHLNEWFIREESNDNKNGVVFTGKGEEPDRDQWARDSRKVEINITPDKVGINWESIEFFVQSHNGERKKVTEYIISGIPASRNRNFVYPEIEEGKGRCYRFDARKFFSGTVKVLVYAKDLTGKTVKKLNFTYWDIEDFKSSIYGKDGIVDEKNFQEDVAIPVKAFLENSDNRLLDGKLLKDHILYIVVCHGLPFSCKSVFGIERGVTPHGKNYGVLGSLEQRLQTLYYGWGKQIMPPVVSRYRTGGPDKNSGIINYKITSALNFPLTGRRWNPYMHPDTYSSLNRKDQPIFIDLPFLEGERKKTESYLFAYGVSRIDGAGPREAKRIIDYSLYASKYLRPEMVNKQNEHDLSSMLQKVEKRNIWGKEELKFLNFPIISKYDKGGLPFLKRKYEVKATPSKQNQVFEYSGYFPGGMDRRVVSSNGWNMGRSAPIWKQIDQGVTVSACGGPAYGDGPHITNATFWDNRILMRYLFRGRDLGECFLRSTLYVNWATSLLGDPLYHPDLNKTIFDMIPPKVSAKEDISIELFSTMDVYSGIMRVPVESTRENPEVCLLSVRYYKKGEKTHQEASWPIYSKQPYVILRNLEPDSTYFCQPVLTDPYGNFTDLTQKFGVISFKTGSFFEKKYITRTAKKNKKGWEIDCSRILEMYEKATIQIEFIAGVQGNFPSFRSKGIRFKSVKHPDKKNIEIKYALGGPTKREKLESPLKEGEKATLVIRWRKLPLTREILLKARDGSEFTIAADVRTPWVKIKPDSVIRLGQRHGVEILSGKIINDAFPASEEACGLKVRPVDMSLWQSANK